MRYIIFIVIVIVFSGNSVKAQETTKNYATIENGGVTCGIANGLYKKAAYAKKMQEVEKFTINTSAYTAAADECGKSDGITASGNKVTKNRTLACPRNYKFGTEIYIEGMGTYICEDRGGAIKGNRFDIYMETKTEAFAFGRKELTAYVVI